MAYHPVKNYNDSMAGIPQLDNNFERLTLMLDAIMVDGFNPKVITSIVRVDTTATAQCAAHGYVVDQIVNIAGVDQSDYNGDQRVTSVTTNSFTFDVPNTAVTPATAAGTINVKAAPLGFERVFTAQGKRVYRSPNVLSARPYLRVDDTQLVGWTSTYAKFGRVAMASAMADVDTFISDKTPYDPTNPNKGEVLSGSGATAYAGWYKWYYARNASGSADSSPPNPGNRSFTLIGDDRGFHFFPQWVPKSDNWNPQKAWYAFGDIDSWKAGDGFGAMLIATEGYYNAQGIGMYHASFSEGAKYNNYEGKALMRDYTSMGYYTRFTHLSISLGESINVSGFTNSVPYPNGPDFGLVLMPVYIKEERRGDWRGIQPGVYFTPHQYPLSDGVKVEAVPGYPGRKFMCVETSTSSTTGNTLPSTNPRIFIDMTGPWR